MKKILGILLTLCMTAIPAFARMPGAPPVGPGAGIPSSVYDSAGDGKIDNDAGGTGIDTSSSTGFMVVESGVWSVKAKGSANQYLYVDSNGDYKWATIVGGGDMVEANWASSSAIRVDHGGTQKTSWTQYAIPYLSGTTTFSEVAIGVYGQCLKVASGATGYEWGSCGTTDFDLITNKPTTLYGYGIVDAAPLSHTTNTSNPHTVTKSQVGLSSVENTQLSTWAGTSNITTIGTLSAGTVPIARVSGGAPSASPTFTGTVTIPSPFTIGATSVTTSGAEFNYVDGVTSNIQTQLNAKAPSSSPTFTGTVTIPTPFTLGATSVTPDGTEFNYLDGVTSSIQTQLDGKQATITDNTIAPSRLQRGAQAPGSGYYYRGDGVWAAPSGSGDMLESNWATGGAINVAKGGTEKTSWTQYAIPYLSATTTFGEVTIGSANECLKVNGTANGYTWGTCGSGSGDVVGPSSSTDGDIALFDGPTGKLLKDGGTVTSAGLALLDDADAAAQRATLAVQPTASPTFTGTVTVPSPFTLGATSVTATGTEINHLSGVTSNIQTQIGNKAPTASPTFTGTVTIPSPFTLGATSVTATGAELNHVAGVTSAIQTQIDAKEPTITQGSILPSELQDNSTSPDSTKYYRGDGKWVVPPGGGDVTGPASSVDGGIATFSGTGGKTLQDSTYTITPAGGALLDDADAAAQRTTLGLGTIATQAASSVSITGGTITGVTMAAKQDADADLTTLADSPSNHDKIFYANNTGVVQTVGLGTAGTCLKSQGTGSAPTFGVCGAGSPGGSDTQVQINDGGSFGGDAGFTYNKTLDTVTIDNTAKAKRFESTESDGNHFYNDSNTNDYSSSTEGDQWTNRTDDVHKYYDGSNNVVVWKAIQEKEFTITSPTDSMDFPTRFSYRAMTVTKLDCIVDPGDTGDSITVAIWECDSTGDNCADGGISVTADNDGDVDITFTDADFDANDRKFVYLGTPSGTVDVLNCTISYREL